MQHSRKSHRLLLAGAVLCAAALAADSAEPAPPEERTFLRGMTVSCPMYGQIWGSPAMARSLDELAEIGVRWVAIHPYAGVRRDGSIRWRPAADTGYLERAVEIARRAGIELFWKPHLAYWGSFEWRGEIEFGDDETRWRRFFEGYRRFIVDQARFAERSGISLFSVGVELEQTTGHEAEWRRILAEVRRVYSGRITYAANWDRLDAVPFWDALDLIGVQAYFPLSHAPQPDAADLHRGWDRTLAELRRSAAAHRKPVLFAEIGYNASPDAAREPWSYRSRDTAQSRALQRLLVEVALERAEAEPLIHGMFWWKWIPGQRGRYDFAMQPADLRETLRRAWRDPVEHGAR